ncbi:MAG: PIN domain-containing protein [Sideroxyarcus sp.]|nr:PIN domain-containing protein [Sideroxyarcus sp.]
MKCFFVDTNLFLQCRDVIDLPWGDISDRKPVQLIIPRAVQHEIDKLKADGNSRRAKRARSTNSYFRQIILSDDEQFQVRGNSGVDVALTFSSHVAASPSDVAEVALDSNRPDDSILLELISYRALNPEQDVALLTHDTNPLLTAKRLKIPYQVIPDEWLLTPEPDEREKEIRILKTRISEIESSQPKFEFTFGEEGAAVPDKINAEIVVYPPLAQSEVELLIQEIEAAYPMAEHFTEETVSKSNAFAAPAISLTAAQFMRGKYKPPSFEEIEKYKNEDYPGWLREVERKLAGLPDFLSEQNNKIGISLALSNIGNMPAEHAIFKIEVPSAILIAPPIDEGEAIQDWEFNKPPSPPRGEYTSVNTFLGLDAFKLGNMLHGSALHNLETGLSPLGLPRNRDRNGFYWKPNRPRMPQSQWEFECEEFVHKDVPEEFYFTLLVDLGKRPSRGVLALTVRAKNLAHPESIKVPLKISYVEENSMDEARRRCGLNQLISGSPRRAQ